MNRQGTSSSFLSVRIWTEIKSALALAAIIASGWTSVAQDSSARPKLNHDPDAAKLVTSDLDNFWRAYALADHGADKRQAIREILTVRDFPAFVSRSHYPEKFSGE